MNHVTAAERRALLEAALELVTLDDADGSIVGGLDAVAGPLADEQNVSLARARTACSHAARIKRHPAYAAPSWGRPKLDTDDPTERIAITLPGSLVAKAERLGNGNVSAGVRLALEQAA